MSYQPIEDYGITGDPHAVALVGLNGSIDGLCYPHFDSPSVFAAILDDGKGGCLAISPAQSDGIAHKQFYWPEGRCVVRFVSVVRGACGQLQFDINLVCENRAREYEWAWEVCGGRVPGGNRNE